MMIQSPNRVTVELDQLAEKAWKFGIPPTLPSSDDTFEKITALVAQGWTFHPRPPSIPDNLHKCWKWVVLSDDSEKSDIFRKLIAKCRSLQDRTWNVNMGGQPFAMDETTWELLLAESPFLRAVFDPLSRGVIENEECPIANPQTFRIMLSLLKRETECLADLSPNTLLQVLRDADFLGMETISQLCFEKLKQHNQALELRHLLEILESPQARHIQVEEKLLGFLKQHLDSFTDIQQLIDFRGIFGQRLDRLDFISKDNPAQTLNLKQYKALSTEQMGRLIPLCPHVESILVKYADFDDSTVHSITVAYPQLTGLSLISCKKLTDASMLSITRLSRLQELNLSVCRRLTDAAFNDLHRLTSLQRLHVQTLDITAQAGIAIGRATNLRSLNLSFSRYLTTEVLSGLTNLTNLEELDLSHCEQLTDRGFHLISLLTKLQCLNFESCPQIGNRAAKAILGLTQLNQLNLSGCFGIKENYRSRLADWALNPDIDYRPPSLE